MRLTTCLLGLLLVGPAEAQTVPPAPPAQSGDPCASCAVPRFDFPILDIPYNVASGLRGPGMAQALSLSEAFYEGTHLAIRRAWHGRGWQTRLSIALWETFASLLLPLPGSDGWLHEEFHRAVLGRRGIDSFNDVYRFRLGGSAIYVSHVRDEDLVRLKREHPAEQIRLSAAGIEGEYLLVQALEQRQFFARSPAWHLPEYIVAKLGSLGYVVSTTWDIVNRGTDTLNIEDGADVKVRDFTGHDIAAWVYDLFRPGEPYAARGVHPSGVGIDRYIKPADLTAAELRYVHRQGRLQILNFIDPFLISRRVFTIANPLNGRPLRFNATAGHVLTPFGRTVDANVFLEQDDVRVFAVIHTYGNGRRQLPGFEARLLDYPIRVRGRLLTISPRAAVWLQPARQRFDTRSVDPGGLLSVKVNAGARGRLGVFGEVEAKSPGWVAGNPYLGSNVSLRLGASIAVH
jgi:hypothetical protein